MTVEKQSHHNLFLSTNELICFVLVFCFLIIGIYLHIKLIIVSKKEKDMTWTLDATNSCIVLTYFVQYTTISIITMMVDNLYMYTGKWFCYFANFLCYYGATYVHAHSLVIAVLKYIHIVWWMKVMNFGKETLNTVFFWINLLNPAVAILIHLITTPDLFIIWTAYPHVDKCLGIGKESKMINVTYARPKMHDLCLEIPEPSPANYFRYTLYIFEYTTCWTQVIVRILVFWNLLEAIFYSLIFRFMRR